MQWLEVRVKTSNDGVEPVLGLLMSCGIQQAQIINDEEMECFFSDNIANWDYKDDSLTGSIDTSGGVSREAFVLFYLSNSPAGYETLAEVSDHLPSLARIAPEVSFGSLELDVKQVDDNSWLNEWKKYFKPFSVGRKIIVRPFWEDYSPADEEIVFTINPGAVFGTGLHATTQMAASAIEDFIQPGDSVLDIGCGSGILSVIAMLLGADRVFACDIDPAAEINVRENARLNNIDPSRVSVRTGDIFSDSDLINAICLNNNRYDIVVANIVADVIIRLTIPVHDYIEKNGLFIVSGIITERVDEVRASLRENGWVVVTEFEREGWHCIVSRSNYA